jgi:hypothetical protein
VLFSTFLKAERSVRFNSLALAPSISVSSHLGFDNELVARFAEAALRRQLFKGVLDRSGIRARVALIRHRNVCGLLCKRSSRADTLHIFHLLSPGRVSRCSVRFGAVLMILCGREAEDKRKAAGSILDHRASQVESVERNMAACAVGADAFEIAVGDHSRKENQFQEGAAPTT